MSITFSTCWYKFKCKFENDVYFEWIDNMLTNVNNYYLVIYCDNSSKSDVEKYASNPRIKIVVKPHNQFYNYKYRENWILNHEKNDLLKDKIDWKVNMLWAEKIHFVYDTIQNEYFDTEFYGWCDIGYFRNREFDLSKETLAMWPNPEKIKELNSEKVYYGCVQNNGDYLIALTNTVSDRNDDKLPRVPIDPSQISIAGGFFLARKDKVKPWRDIFDEKLALYFKHKYLVKDDQMIILDCMMSHPDIFFISREYDNRYDIWFMFQRLLL